MKRLEMGSELLKILARVPTPVHIAAVILLLSGCASTKTVSVWKDDAFTGPPFENLLVIGVSEDNSDRNTFESEFAKSVAANGRSATPSAQLLKGPEKLTKEAVDEVLNNGDFDAVLVTRVVGVGERASYVNPEPYYRTYNGYYSTVYDYAYQPGYYHQYSVYHLETNIYDAQSKQLVWTMRSDAVAPKSVAKVVGTLSAQIINQLKQDGVI